VLQVLGNLALCLLAAKAKDTQSTTRTVHRWPAWMNKMLAAQRAFDMLLEGKVLQASTHRDMNISLNDV